MIGYLATSSLYKATISSPLNTRPPVMKAVVSMTSVAALRSGFVWQSLQAPIELTR